MIAYIILFLIAGAGSVNIIVQDPIWTMLQSVPDTAGSLTSYVLYYIHNPNLNPTNVPVGLQLVIEHGFTALSEQNLRQLLEMDTVQAINMINMSERPMDALEFHNATANMNFAW